MLGKPYEKLKNPEIILEKSLQTCIDTRKGGNSSSTAIAHVMKNKDPIKKTEFEALEIKAEHERNTPNGFNLTTTAHPEVLSNSGQPWDSRPTT
jgi:hypothetical protein